MNEKQIIDGLRPICKCKGIKKRTFLNQIRAGIRTVEGLKKATGAGSGSCKGKQCTERIEALLKSGPET